MGDDQNRAPCGTEAAYRRHGRVGEKPCQDCKRAAAAARARRRGQPEEQAAPKTMVDLAAEEIAAGQLPWSSDGMPAWAKAADEMPAQSEPVEYTGELNKLYGILGTAMQFAAPRETASIAREMRGILHDLRDDAKSSAKGPSLKEQLAEAKRERAARLEARKVASLASGDVEGLVEERA